MSNVATSSNTVKPLTIGDMINTTDDALTNLINSPRDSAAAWEEDDGNTETNNVVEDDNDNSPINLKYQSTKTVVCGDKTIRFQVGPTRDNVSGKHNFGTFASYEGGRKWIFTFEIHISKGSSGYSVFIHKKDELARILEDCLNNSANVSEALDIMFDKTEIDSNGNFKLKQSIIKKIKAKHYTPIRAPGAWELSADKIKDLLNKQENSLVQNTYNVKSMSAAIDEHSKKIIEVDELLSKNLRILNSLPEFRETKKDDVKSLKLLETKETELKNNVAKFRNELDRLRVIHKVCTTRLNDYNKINDACEKEISKLKDRLAEAELKNKLDDELTQFAFTL